MSRLKWIGWVVLAAAVSLVALVLGRRFGFLIPASQRAALAAQESATRIAAVNADVAEAEAARVKHTNAAAASKVAAAKARAKAEALEAQRVALLSQMRQDESLSEEEYARRFNSRYGLDAPDEPGRG